MTDFHELPPVQVLFVDDEENILKSLRRLLQDEEFEVLTAGSGGAALQLLQEAEHVGLIVSDQRMPGLSGVEFLEQAKSVAPQALRIMLTGYADINATIDAINRGGAYRYITKPWNDDEIVLTIRDAVRHYRLEEENRRLAAIVARQNEELQEWNANLKQRVLEQTTEIRKKHEELQNANERLRESYRNTILAFSRLIELRGKKLQNHSTNVATLALNVAKALGLSAEEAETIHVAAMLHDIGEIGIPEAILHKLPEEMTPTELAEYQRHAVRGQTAIDAMEDLREAGILIRHHHEYFDGSGFPDRLTGEQIPLGARIIAMADYIDGAMQNLYGTSAMENALWKVGTELGKKLDPGLLPTFRKFLKYVYYAKTEPGGKELAPLGKGDEAEQSAFEQVEKELKPTELEPGLVLAQSIYSGTGMLLLSRGTQLDQAKVAAIQRYYRLDPPTTGIFVWSRQKKQQRH
ncbi:two-component system response regulator [Geotalea uraniireducens]|uniref:Two-component system response regulator n=1 Tax=Geotalea uraniireducens TaxID=351604 RepID=A0ABM8EFG7_9BACT|nr:HD domain-containing phosphohydrolase [Geotalea uraniireducens]BDV41131.1 two-component system response regulator [Geotalea uraniireducens]